MKILVPDAIELNLAVPHAEIVRYRADSVIPPEHRDAEMLVVWGVPHDVLTQDAELMPQLRLAQSLAAGPDSILKAGFAPSVTLAGGAGLHTATVTEHALALTLAMVRQLPQARSAQDDHRWASEIGGVRPLHPEGPITTLIDARVLIWGFGHIGVNLAKVLSSLNANVRGVATTPGIREGFEVVATDQIDAELPTTDVLIMLLPGNEDTRNCLDAHRLSLLPKGSFVVNAGRGITVDETALDQALRSGHLAGAGLDVMATEPLPKDSPLWDAPGCIITPHAAGGRPVGAEKLIFDQAQALAHDWPLLNVIPR